MKIKATIENQKQLIPNAAIRAAFLSRPDIKTLPKDEQERRWRTQLAGVNRFRAMLDGITCHVMPRRKPNFSTRRASVRGKFVVWIREDGRWVKQGDGPMTQKQAERVTREIRNDFRVRVAMLPVGTFPDLG